MSRAQPYIWYPAFVGLAIASFFALLARGASPVVAAYAPILLVGIVIIVLERHCVERETWRPTRSEVLTDSAFMAVVMVALPRLLAALVTIAFADYLHVNHRSAWWPHEWPLWAQMIAMVLIVDFVRYWLHRACHEFTPLWRLHEVHHSPDVLYVLNVGRFHPLEKMLHFALDTVPFLFLGVAPEVFAGYFLLYSVNGLFQHSNVKLRHGWLNYLIASAETHRWHHARDPKLTACNFSNTTIIWDLVFGTWQLPGPVKDIGIMNRQYPKDFLAQLVAPFTSAAPAKSSLGRQWLLNVAVRARLGTHAWLARGRIALATRDPMRAQLRLLRRIVRENRTTAFGRQHGFETIHSHESFAARVPIRDFEELRSFIEAEIERGEAALTARTPVRYVRTSGTTGRPKDVPLTAAHLAKLRRIHRESVAFQYRVRPEAFGGSIVAMVSPAFEGVLANGKLYGSASGIVADNTSARVRDKFVIPPAVLTIAESRVKYLLALRLAIARDDVTYLGAANPTTLLTLVELYRTHEAELIEDVRNGTFFLESSVPAEVMSSIRPRLRPDPVRAQHLRAISGRFRAAQFVDLWPHLKLIVTWTCASAGVALDAVRAELPKHVRIMELGYISSEFRGTITIGRRPGSGLPTFDTHFFEFAKREDWDNGKRTALRLDQLCKGTEYYVIVTTPSGLYRYFINDIVKVTGFLRSTPLLKFSQKGKGVTNITGEKLYEVQVLEAVRNALRSAGATCRFLMALADEAARGYRLYVELEAAAHWDSKMFAHEVDAQLRALNCEYEAKRESERLAPLEVRQLLPGTGERYKAHCVTRGQREGQFKMVALDYRSKFSFDIDAHCAGS